jgi:poly(3-hydroxybutyrate) depolymerase
MESAAAAFAWEFSRRLRVGVIALAGYLLVLAAVQFLAPRPLIRADHELLLAFTVTIPLFGAFMHFLGVFTYGLAGDLAARQSMYPARMFTLPVPTGALAGYPMLYGALAVAGLYVVANLVAFRPAGLDFPVAWPPLFLAVFLAWMQVFTWMPYGLPGIRAVIAVLSLLVLDAVVMVALELRVRESVMIAILAPQIPLAYLAARYAVGRARRGEVPDWGTLGRLREKAGATRSPDRFLSPRRAQLWFELRQQGRSLPGWVAIVVPFELALLYVVRDEPRVLTAIALVGMLLTPPFLAAFVAANVSFTSFLATRPLGTAALVSAKLKMALASTAAAWLLLLLALPLGVTLSDAWPVVVARFDAVARFMGAPRTAALAFLTVVFLFASTWKQLVQGLCIGLTGREGLIKGSVLLRLCWLVVLGLVVHGVMKSREVGSALWNGAPWILAVLASLKVCGAAWTATRLARARLIGDRALVAGAASWVVAVGALYGVLAWLLDAPHVARYILLLLAILAVPLVRPALAALALAWNRHRGPAPSAANAVVGARRAVAAVHTLLALPLALALVEAVSFQVRNRTNGVLVSSGVEREYLLHVPKSYDPARPTPLVISLHGGAMWPAAQMETSRWNAVADAQGFLVVYPAGSGSGRMRVWHMGSEPDGVAEVRFISDLIDALQARYNIDPRRVYADGLSNGGGMAFVLSCTLSDRIAAVGLVGSAQLLPWEWCRDERPVPMVNFHGTEDRFTPYHGGQSPAAPDPFPDVTSWTANWARRNRCTGKAAESRVAPDVTRLEYSGCADDASVVLYTIHGGGHTWPGGGQLPEWFAGRTSNGVHASLEAWRFFSAHPLRATKGGDGRDPAPTAGESPGADR